MRKFLLAALALLACVGLTIAAEVVFVNYDKEKKELKVKDGDEEKTYTVTADTKFKRGDEEVANDKGIANLEKMAASDKAKGKSKFEITVEGKEVKEIKMKARKKN